MELELKEDEVLDDLEYKNLKIIQKTDGFKFGMDAILLTNFSKNIKKKAKVLELGTGTGVISILLSEKTESNRIIGIEIQEQISEMAQRSVKLNHLEDKVEIINDDVKNIEKVLKKSTFDVVVTNPPYKKKNTGIINDNEIKLISRHEITAKLEDFIKVGSNMLKSNGEFYMVHRPDRIADIVCLLRKYKLEPKILQLVYPKLGEKANLLLIKAVKNGGEFLNVEKPLYIYNDNGTYTKELLEIYGK